MSVSSRQRPPSAPSTASLQHTASVRSTSARRPPPLQTVITVPPWASDEPPSPQSLTHHTSPLLDANQGEDSRLSDVASYTTSMANSTSRWWPFTLPRNARQFYPSIPTTPKFEKGRLRDLSISWLPTSSSLREGAAFARKDKNTQPGTTELNDRQSINRDWNMSIPLPSAPPAPYTLAHNATPGWDSPWTPRTAAQGPNHQSEEAGGYAAEETEGSLKNSSKWRRRKKRLRKFILNNTYVPLLFRMINIAFTTSALAIAIRIRRLEISGHAMGAIGSSPTVVIIFAPLTLVHVMVAIYLEYFGRPLGLWRTSAKLAHTLSEVLFICAWSAALSLCFDNFFTSLVPCASASSISWYNEISRPTIPLSNLEGGLGDQVCDHQLALICLVGIGLLAYCANLVISLFRIFEKVKYHPASIRR